MEIITNLKTMDLKKKQELINKYAKRIDNYYPEADKIAIDLEQFAQEIVKLFAMPTDIQYRKLLIGYSKLVLGDNYQVFEQMEIDRINRYLDDLKLLTWK